MRIRQEGEKRWYLVVDILFFEIKIPVSLKLKDILMPILPVEGITFYTTFINNKELINNKKFKSYLEEDEFGVYKKEGVDIPFRFKKKYEELKDSREYHIYRNYCGLNRFAIYKRKNESYRDYIIRKPSKEIEDKMKKLLSKG